MTFSRLGELPVPQPDPEAVGEAADEILRRPEFRRPAPSLFDRAQDWISEQLGRLFAELVGSGAGTAVAWIVLATFVGLIVYFATRLGRSVTADRASGSRPEMVEPSRSPSQWRAEAERLEAVGDFKEGLLARYRAVVGQLVLDGVVDEIPGRTTGEYRREVRTRRADLHVPFDEVSTLFERAWYGDEPTGGVERDRFVALDLEISGARR